MKAETLDFTELSVLTDSEIRVIVPMSRYYILFTACLVRTNKGMLYRAISKDVFYYHKNIEGCVNHFKTHPEQYKLHLLESVVYKDR